MTQLCTALNFFKVCNLSTFSVAYLHLTCETKLQQSALISKSEIAGVRQGAVSVRVFRDNVTYKVVSRDTFSGGRAYFQLVEY